MNLKEYFKSKDVSYKITDKNSIKIIKIVKNNTLPYNNRTVYGNCIKKELTTPISISKPKFWPKKGYYEIN